MAGEHPTDRRTERLVPPWLDRLGAVGWRVLAIVLLVLVLLAIAIELASATAATLVALILVTALAPTVRRLRTAGRSPTAAAAIACLVGGGVLVGALVLVVLALVPDAMAIVSAVTSGLADVRDQLLALGAPELVLRTYDRFVESVLGLLAVDVTGLLGRAVTVGTVAVLGSFLTFFLLQDGDRAWAWMMQSQPAWRVGPLTASAQGGLERVGWYLRRTSVLATLDALVVWAILLAFGVPLAGSLAAVAFIAGFVPYLGAVLGTGIVALAALALAGPPAAAAVVVGLLATWLVSTRLLERTSMNRRVDVHPVLVLLVLPIGAALFGLVGLIVLLPLVVFVLAIGRSVLDALDLEPDAAPAARRADGLPVWLDRLAQWSWRGLVIAGLAYIAIQLIVLIPGVVVPTLIAVVAAATLRPVVNRLVRAGWSRGAAAGAAALGASLVIVATIAAALALTIGPMRDIVAVSVQGAEVTDLAWVVDVVTEVGTALVIDVGALLAGAFGLLFALALALLLTIFLLRDGPAWWRRVMARIGPGRREPVAEAGRRAADALAGYMIGTAIISAFGAFTSGLIMVLLGLPLAVPIAVLTFFASFIPYIGSAITTALALLVAVAVGEPSDIVIMLIYTVVFNIVQGNFVTPIVYGGRLSLHPAVVLMAIPVGGEIAGILGMFLAVPIVAMVAVTWRLALQAISDEGTVAGGQEPARET